jgi:BTB/POZ domain-containing protein KCTD9
MKFSGIKKGLVHTLEKTLESPLMISFSVLVIVGSIVLLISMPMYLADSHNFLINILSELHGMIFDLFVIGILITWLNLLGQKRRDIRSYKDEIDDFRMWESEEAAYRIVGNIKRLNRYNIYDIDLVNCFLSKTNLSYVVLKGANLNNANASNSTLVDINLEGARLNRTNFENSNLNQVNLKRAYASGTNFKDAYMIKANLEHAFLIKADFKNAFLMEANLRSANLTSANLDNANLYKADLRDTVGLTIEQLSGVRTLYLAKFDDSVLEELQLKYPVLLGK